MPSWEIHSSIAEMFGIPRGEAEAVNKLVDAGVVHDLGRNLPELGLREKIEAPEFTSIALQKVRDAADALSNLSISPRNTAFYLHHALDYLSWWVASAMLVGRSPLEYRENILMGVKWELRLIQQAVSNYGRECRTRFPIPSRSFNEDLDSRFNAIVSLTPLQEWVRSVIVARREEIDHTPLQEVVSAKLAESKTRSEGYKRRRIEQEMSMFPSSITLAAVSDLAKAVGEENGKRYEKGSMFYFISKLSASRSRLYDYTLLAGHSMEITSQILLRVGEKQAGGLGRAVTHYFEGPEDYDKVREYVRRDVKRFCDVWCAPRGVSVSDEVLNSYWETLLGSMKVLEDKGP